MDLDLTIRKEFTATAVKGESGRYIESAIKGPTALNKSGRVIAVTVPIELWEQIVEALEMGKVCGK